MVRLNCLHFVNSWRHNGQRKTYVEEPSIIWCRICFDWIHHILPFKDKLTTRFLVQMQCLLVSNNDSWFGFLSIFILVFWTLCNNFLINGPFYYLGGTFFHKRDAAHLLPTRLWYIKTVNTDRTTGARGRSTWRRAARCNHHGAGAAHTLDVFIMKSS